MDQSTQACQASGVLIALVFFDIIQYIEVAWDCGGNVAIEGGNLASAKIFTALGRERSSR